MTTTNGTLAIIDDPESAAIGTDEHRVALASWVLRIFEPDAPVYKDAVKVVRCYLAGKPLPSPR